MTDLWTICTAQPTKYPETFDLLKNLLSLTKLYIQFNNFKGHTVQTFKFLATGFYPKLQLK